MAAAPVVAVVVVVDVVVVVVDMRLQRRPSFDPPDGELHFRRNRAGKKSARNTFWPEQKIRIKIGSYKKTQKEIKNMKLRIWKNKISTN